MAFRFIRALTSTASRSLVPQFLRTLSTAGPQGTEVRLSNAILRPVLHTRSASQAPIVRIMPSMRVNNVTGWTQVRGIMTRAGLRFTQSPRPSRSVLRQLIRYASNFERRNLSRPRSWAAVGGLILAGGIVLWATSGWIIAIFATMVKIVFYGVLTAGMFTRRHRPIALHSSDFTFGNLV